MRNKVVVFLALTAVFCSIIMTKADAAVIYTVQPKDTLWKIAKSNGVSMDLILKSNPDLKSEKDLKNGMALMIPERDEEVVPIDEETTEVHSIVLHGNGKTKNTMTVNGHSYDVPTFALSKPAKLKAKPTSSTNYKSKYHNLSSRGLIRGNSIVTSAMRFLGTPYVWGGTTPGGFDCSGFIQYVYKLNGIKTPRLAHHQCYAGTPVSKANLRPGDLVFFETYTVGISHVGIYIGDSKFVHASSSGVVRINSLNQEYYSSRYRAGARYYN